MLTIYSLLERNWQVICHHSHYSAEDVSMMTKGCADTVVRYCRDRPQGEQNKLFVFVIRNNFEGMISYFVASVLKLKAWIVSIHDLDIVDILVDADCIAAVVMSHEVRDINIISHRINIAFDHCLSTVNKNLADFTAYPCAHFYFCTSGTTSKPKLIQYHENILIENAIAVSQSLGLSNEDCSLCYFPVQYMYGLSTMLCAFLSDSKLVFEKFQISNIGELVSHYSITNLPLIGDWMLVVSDIFTKSRIHVQNILNASDRLLTVQASGILSSCTTLWNNFGQTESGPRLFHNKICSLHDNERTSKYGVVAPGKAFVSDIKIDLRPIDRTDASDSMRRMFYKTPFACDGYVDSSLQLKPRDEWFDSGDLFVKDESECYYWIARAVNEFKHNGKFIPVQLISNDIIKYAGCLRHYFSKAQNGDLYLNLDMSANSEQVKVVTKLLTDKWYQYAFKVNIRKIATTNTGKIKCTV
ncbi:AMP-binding protein [Bartonella sp. AA74HLJMH]|uniref:AMP-binding protein n=1 Tax=Bartonella sp. AA74HLJMH TaxID=3243436 RepID=UPI0035CF3101